MWADKNNEIKRLIPTDNLLLLCQQQQSCWRWNGRIEEYLWSSSWDNRRSWTQNNPDRTHHNVMDTQLPRNAGNIDNTPPSQQTSCFIPIWFHYSANTETPPWFILQHFVLNIGKQFLFGSIVDGDAINWRRRKCCLFYSTLLCRERNRDQFMIGLENRDMKKKLGNFSWELINIYGD